MTTQHFVTRNPEMRTALLAQGLREATMIFAHECTMRSPSGAVVVDYARVARQMVELSRSGTKDALLFWNIEYQGEAGPAWFDPDPLRTSDFRRFLATAEMCINIHRLAQNLVSDCPCTCTEAWLLPAWNYTDRYSNGTRDTHWARNACTVRGSGMNDDASAVYGQQWASDSDVSGRIALANLDWYIECSNFWAFRNLPRYFQLSPTTKGTATTGGLLHPPEYLRAASDRVRAAGHNIVWFIGNVQVQDVEIPAHEVTPTSDAGRTVLENIRAAMTVGGGVE